MTRDVRIGSLCTGYGGLDLAVEEVFGGELAWVSEVDPAASAVCAARFPEVPNLGDLRAVDWSEIEPVDLITSGYPCQPFSSAGRRHGTEDPRHLWPGVARAVGALRPRLVVLENVDRHLRDGFDRVLGDLAELGYDAAWTVVRASESVGAAHRRARLFCLAWDPGRPPADAERAPGHERPGLALAGAGGAPDGVRQAEPGGRRRAPADAAPEHIYGSGDLGQVGRPEPPDRGVAVPDAGHRPLTERPRDQGRDLRQRQAERCEPASGGPVPVDWREFGPAVRRWELAVGRPAPVPSVIGPRGGAKVNPAFAEWLMGLPEGWVTGVPDLTVTQMLRVVGNGVVPQQAAAALRYLASVAGLEP